MIRNIDGKYDIIITTSPIDEITGHIFECFDYFLFLRQYYKVGILFLGGIGETKLRKVFNDKYNFSYDDFLSDIIIVNKEEFDRSNIFVFEKETFVLLCDGNIHQLDLYNIKLMTKKLYGFLCADKGEISSFNSVHKHIIYLLDKRIYHERYNYTTIDYVKKIPFQFYRKSNKEFNNTGMMYVTYACRKVNSEVIKTYHENSGCSKTILVVPYKLEEYENIDDVEQIEAPVDDFFNKFDTYIYTPVQRHFDCSPRLITECFLQNKKVFLDINYVDLGLQTRYNDCKEDINRIILKENDKILEIIENAKRN